jgi:putative acetyltransferase
MSWTIEIANPQDHADIITVWEAAVLATHHFLSAEEVAFFKNIMPDYLHRATDLRCVRDASSQIIGFSGVADGNLDMLFVAPNYFGCGVGSALLLHAINRQNASTVDVNEANPKAQQFYFRHGFELVGRSEMDGTGKPNPILHLQLKHLGRQQ